MFPIDAWVDDILRRLPGGGRLATIKDRLATFADQGFQGLGNILAASLFAHALSRDDFAAMGVAIGIYYFVAGLLRAGLTLQFIVITARPGGYETQDRQAWFWLNALVVAGITVLLAAIAAVMMALRGGASPTFQLIAVAMALTAAITPLMLLAEFARRLLYQSRLTVAAALASAAQCVGMVGLALVAWRLGGGLGHVVAGWAIGGLAATLIAVLAQPPGRPGGLRRGLDQWFENPSLVFWQTLNHVPYSIASSSLIVLVGAIGGAGAAAVFNVARTLANPAVAVVSAIDALDKPRAARALAHEGLGAVVHSIHRTRRLLVVLTGGYLLAVSLLASWIIPFAFGPQYAGAETTVRILAVAFFIICLNQPSESLLIVLGESRLMFTMRCVAAVVTLAGLVVAAPHGTVGFGISVAAAQAINLMLLVFAERLARRRYAIRNGGDGGRDPRTLLAMN